jgi:hypothetical protein
MSQAYNQTFGTVVQAWCTTVTGAVTISSEIDVHGKLGARFFVFAGRESSTAFTEGWPLFRIEAAGKAADDDAWVPIGVFAMAIGATIAATTLNGAISAEATTCVVTSATNIAIGDTLFLGHTTDTTKYELVRVKGISGTTVTFEEPCTYAHDTGAKVTDQAQAMTGDYALDTVGRIRLVIDNSNGGQSVHARVLMHTLDSVG